MNPHYLHLLTNHLPLGALIFGVAIFLIGLVRQRGAYERIGLGLLVAGALLALPVLLSGEGAEEMVEHLPSFGRADHRVLHKHEEAGELAFWLMQVLGVVSLVTLWARGPWQQTYTLLRWAVLVAAAVAFWGMHGASQIGGRVRRPELREAADTTRTIRSPVPKAEEPKADEKEKGEGQDDKD